MATTRQFHYAIDIPEPYLVALDAQAALRGMELEQLLSSTFTEALWRLLFGAKDPGPAVSDDGTGAGK